MAKDNEKRMMDMMQAFDVRTVRPEDLASVTQGILSTVKEVRELLETRLTDSQSESKTSVEQITTSLSDLEERIQGLISDTKETGLSQIKELSQTLSTEIQRIESLIPDITDLSPLEQKIDAGIAALEAKIPVIPELEELKAEGIRNKLETLEGKERLNASAIDGLDEKENKLTDSIINRAIGIVDQRTSFLINRVSNLSDRVDTLNTGGPVSVEGAQDAVGSILTDSTTIDFTYDDATPTITADIINGSVTLAKLANVATGTVFYRQTAGTGVPEVQTLATLKTDLGLTGTNSGDQTTIAGITGTKAQFDTAVIDGNFLYVGDITQYTDELAQDAVGAMVNATLSYVDATPLLGINLSNANTWLADQSVPDEAYGVGWNGSMEVPTKNAVYDKMETIVTGAGGLISYTGAVDGSNTVFVFSAEPTILYIDGVPTQKVSSDSTVNWTGTTTVTLANAPQSDLYGTSTLGGSSGGGGDALIANPLSQFAPTTSLQLKDTITDETGSGALVFATSPTLVTPALGTPSALVGTNITGTAASLTAGAATILATGRTIGITGDVTYTSPSFNGSGNVTAAATVVAASLTVAGKVELATSTEINTGTDSTRAMPVDQYNASNKNVRYLLYRLLAATTAVSVANGVGGDLEVPFGGTITEVGVYADTAGTTGLMTVDFNKNGSTILSTKVTVDSTEKTSRTAATPAVISVSTISAGDILAFDIDGIQTTAALGLVIRIGIRQS